jgi:hypothetical protein
MNRRTSKRHIPILFLAVVLLLAPVFSVLQDVPDQTSHDPKAGNAFVIASGHRLDAGAPAGAAPQAWVDCRFPAEGKNPIIRIYPTIPGSLVEDSITKESYLDHFPAGKKIKVYYFPGKPELATTRVTSAAPTLPSTSLNLPPMILGLICLLYSVRTRAGSPDKAPNGT